MLDRRDLKEAEFFSRAHSPGGWNSPGISKGIAWEVSSVGGACVSDNHDDGASPGMCPNCGSEVFYRYGRTRHGKQRYQCLLCGRQFIVDRQRIEVQNKPVCPVCGSGMHLYKREKGLLRFRCARYPQCRCYVKLPGRES